FAAVFLFLRMEILKEFCSGLDFQKYLKHIPVGLLAHLEGYTVPRLFVSPYVGDMVPCIFNSSVGCGNPCFRLLCARRHFQEVEIAAHRVSLHNPPSSHLSVWVLRCQQCRRGGNDLVTLSKAYRPFFEAWFLVL